MARTVAALPAGSRITDYISLGVVAKAFPSEKVRAVLEGVGKQSVRQRDLPAQVVVYYVIALALYMQSSYPSHAVLLMRDRDTQRVFIGWFEEFARRRSGQSSPQHGTGSGASAL